MGVTEGEFCVSCDPTACRTGTWPHPDGSFYVVESGKRASSGSTRSASFRDDVGGEGEADGQLFRAHRRGPVTPTAASTSPTTSAMTSRSSTRMVPSSSPSAAKARSGGHQGDAGFLDIAVDGTVYATTSTPTASMGTPPMASS